MTNPERLWACVCFVGGPPGICADFERDDVLCDRPGAAPADGYTPIVEYVRADVAAEQTAAALRGEAHETTALRAEVEALRSGEFVRAVATERNAYREALKKVDALMVPGVAWEPWEAKEVAKAALAGKGVG